MLIKYHLISSCTALMLFLTSSCAASAENSHVPASVKDFLIALDSSGECTQELEEPQVESAEDSVLSFIAALKNARSLEKVRHLYADGHKMREESADFTALAEQKRINRIDAPRVLRQDVEKEKAKFLISGYDTSNRRIEIKYYLRPSDKRWLVAKVKRYTPEEAKERRQKREKKQRIASGREEKERIASNSRNLDDLKFSSSNMLSLKSLGPIKKKKRVDKEENEDRFFDLRLVLRDITVKYISPVIAAGVVYGLINWYKGAAAKSKGEPRPESKLKGPGKIVFLFALFALACVLGTLLLIRKPEKKIPDSAEKKYVNPYENVGLTPVHSKAFQVRLEMPESLIKENHIDSSTGVEIQFTTIGYIEGKGKKARSMVISFGQLPGAQAMFDSVKDRNIRERLIKEDGDFFSYDQEGLLTHLINFLARDKVALEKKGKVGFGSNIPGVELEGEIPDDSNRLALLRYYIVGQQYILKQRVVGPRGWVQGKEQKEFLDSLKMLF